MDKVYIPSSAVLKRYADVLVKFALGGGTGIKHGDVVYMTVPECAKPLLYELQRSVIEAGGHAIVNFRPDNDEGYNFSALFYENAGEHQLDHFADKYLRGLIDQVDHTLFIAGETHPHALKTVDPKKIMRRGKSMKPWMDWQREKEHTGKFTWTIGLWGTPQMAKEAGLTHREYWHEIINACFLNDKNPIKRWREVYKEISRFQKKLNTLSPKIEKLHIVGPDENLWITPGEKRQWLAGSGRNIPSFEIFTSPDWRGTEGWVRINQPLYRYGSRVEGIELWFKNGRVIKSKAKKGEKLLREMIATPGADKLGEFSLTDRRHSRIKKFMAHTLYDENMGGPQGNTHIALGASYPDTYMGDVSKLTKEEKERLGFNDSSVHTDVISTARRTVVAHLKDGKEKIIYDNGRFTL